MRAVRGLILLVVITAMFLGCSSNGKKDDNAMTDAVKVVKVGEPISVNDVTNLSDLLSDPKSFVDQTIVLEGKVVKMCKGSGCWVSLDTGVPGNEFYVKSPDHSFVFPKDCETKHLKVQGILKVLKPAEKDAKHDDDQNHVCPEPQYYLDPVGAEVTA